MSLDKYKDEFEYLEELRKLGTINMHSSPFYVAEMFKIEYAQAVKIVSLWMRNYEELANKYKW